MLVYKVQNGTDSKNNMTCGDDRKLILIVIATPRRVIVKEGKTMEDY